MPLHRAARLTAYLFLAALAAWDLWLLLVGTPTPYYSETLPGSQGLVTNVIYQRYPPALPALVALAVVVLALLRDNWLRLAWLGLLTHLIWGGLLLFSRGLYYVAATGVIIVPVALLQWQVTGERRWLWVAWAGPAILLLVGALMSWNWLGYASLGAAIVASVLLVVLGRRYARMKTI